MKDKTLIKIYSSNKMKKKVDYHSTAYIDLWTAYIVGLISLKNLQPIDRGFESSLKNVAFNFWPIWHIRPGDPASWNSDWNYTQNSNGVFCLYRTGPITVIVSHISSKFAGEVVYYLFCIPLLMFFMFNVVYCTGFKVKIRETIIGVFDYSIDKVANARLLYCSLWQIRPTRQKI